MKNLFKIRNLVLLTIMALLGVACSSSDTTTTPTTTADLTITGVASGNANLSILVQALIRANLATTLQGSGSFTVFAPTNAAFTTFLTANGYADINAVPVPELTQILLNHVVIGSVLSSALADNTYIKTLAVGTASTTNKLSMYVTVIAGAVKLNGSSNVITANIAASNGIIHVVDKVIALPTIVTFAVANPNLSTLVSALTYAGQPAFTTILAGTGPFTVFAPTNAAFSQTTVPVGFLQEFNFANLGAIPAATLTSVLQYHVANGNVVSSSLANNQVIQTLAGTMSGQAFTVLVTGTGGGTVISIKDANNRVAKVVLADIQASNGIIHVLDKVLKPM